MSYSALTVFEIIEEKCVKNVTALRLDKPQYTNRKIYKFKNSVDNVVTTNGK